MSAKFKNIEGSAAEAVKNIVDTLPDVECKKHAIDMAVQAIRVTMSGYVERYSLTPADAMIIAGNLILDIGATAAELWPQCRCNCLKCRGN